MTPLVFVAGNFEGYEVIKLNSVSAAVVCLCEVVS